MDRLHFSAIAHTGMALCNPLGDAKVERILSLLELPDGARVLDVGCGKAEWLARIAERFGAHGVGVEPAPLMREAARQRIESMHCGTIELHPVEAAQFSAPAESFDLALCIGSTHAYGSLAGTLAALRSLVRPGGLVLVADSYWKRPPAAEYLAALGASAEDLFTHEGNEALARTHELVPLYSTVASDDEWDDYEGRYLYNVERHLARHPDDPDAEPMRARIRTWRSTYLRWGRDTLGFGAYLLLRPA